jgi:hypothetical protein
MTQKGPSSVDDLCALSLPEGWCRVERGSGPVFALESDLRAAAGDLDRVSLTFGVVVHDAGTDAEFVEQLMRRRVSQGWPDRFETVVDSRPGRGFGWTDGVSDVCSIFVEVTRDRWVEFELAQSSMTRKGRDLRGIALDLLANARWLDVR